MSDAKNLSRLISQSLRDELDEKDKQQLDSHLETDEQSRRFTALSKVIQKSVEFGAESIVENDPPDTPSLSADFKQSMKDSLATAIREKESLSQAGLLSTSMEGAVNRGLEDEEEPGKRRISSDFQLLKRIGQGGLGTVWLARDEQLNRKVAIKELTANAMESAKAWTRFQREAEITGLLEHPNIVPIYQYGNDRTSAEPFYAMRFVGKRTLADAITEYHDRVEAGEADSLELHRLLTVFLDVCGAIAYAHSRGVVHRDLKPENVALDNFGQVVVLDWGLAKLLEDGELCEKVTTRVTLSDSAMNRTVEGDIVGTPLYMAPEQAEGKLEDISEQTDVYGLGATLFSILTGSAPHSRSLDESKSDIRAAVKAIAEKETPRVREYRPTTPRELDAICAKAMAKKQHLRFVGVEEFAETIERWMAGQSNKRSQYEALRMEGRELRSAMQSIVNDLERNVYFMSTLPPIQELIHAESDEDISAWRERLGTIFRGLLNANSDYSSVVYFRVDDDEFSELVRVERSSRDSARVSIVPKSRLRIQKACQYISNLTQLKPDEGITSLESNPYCDSQQAHEAAVVLVSGVPVYDEKTEEVYGVVMIECEIQKILRQQFSRQFLSQEVVAVSDPSQVLMRIEAGQIKQPSIGQTLGDEAPHFEEAAERLQTVSEFVDDSDANIYGARVSLSPNRPGLVYLLKRK